MQQPKSIQEIRSRRKRYRNKKKIIWRGWRTSIDPESFQQSVEEEKRAREMEEKERQQQRKEKEQIKIMVRETQAKETELKYIDLADKANSENDALFLPSFLDLFEDNFQKCQEMERVQEERDKAVQLVTHYRDCCERLKKEKRELHNQLSTNCETVRDFWRNKLLEGSSRGGLLVQKAVKKP